MKITLVTKTATWKKFGLAGVLFFLTKGLLWLTAPLLIYLF